MTWCQIGEALERALLADIDFDGDPALASADQWISDGLATEADGMKEPGAATKARAGSYRSLGGRAADGAREASSGSEIEALLYRRRVQG